jgi:hypothetical protein
MNNLQFLLATVNTITELDYNVFLNHWDIKVS